MNKKYLWKSQPNCLEKISIIYSKTIYLLNDKIQKKTMLIPAPFFDIICTFFTNKFPTQECDKSDYTRKL